MSRGFHSGIWSFLPEGVGKWRCSAFEREISYQLHRDSRCSRYFTSLYGSVSMYPKRSRSKRTAVEIMARRQGRPLVTMPFSTASTSSRVYGDGDTILHTAEVIGGMNSSRLLSLEKRASTHLISAWVTTTLHRPNSQSFKSPFRTLVNTLLHS